MGGERIMGQAMGKGSLKEGRALALGILVSGWW